MGSSVVTRSCRALGAEKLPIARVVPSLLSISLLLRDHQNQVGKYLSIPETRNCSVNLLVTAFIVAPKLAHVWEEKA